MKLLIRRCHEIGVVPAVRTRWEEERSPTEQMQACLDYISREEVHVELRNLIMMILLPKKLHVDDTSQAAFLRAAVSRVSNAKVIYIFI